jgi:uncharacterized protein (TIGR03086 family)
MNDVQTMFTKAQQQFAARVGSIGQNWAAPTPDSDWDVGALVDHLIDEQRWVAPLLRGHDLEAAEKIVKGMASTRADTTLGADRVQEWQDAARAAGDAALEQDVLNRTVHLSRGETPAGDYLNEMVFDLTVHAWDLARALGVDAALPDDLVDYVFAVVQAYGDLSSTGMFDKPVPTADDAPTLDRLIALTGRNPR